MMFGAIWETQIDDVSADKGADVYKRNHVERIHYVFSTSDRYD